MTDNPDTAAFRGEVAQRFGLVPNFFTSTPDAPELVERLWDFARSAYLDNPMPALFKERLFVYLSRFCEVRYCILRHCAFLVGYGHSSGDPAAPVQTIDQAIRLLRMPTPWERDVGPMLGLLLGGPTMVEWPEPETELEDALFVAATLVFVEPGRAETARRALRQALGGRRFEHLMGLLAFIRTAHYWTVVHPDLQREDDVRALLAASEELARLLLQDPEAGRCDMSARLFSELDALRAANERREMVDANKALEHRLVQQDVVLTEVNHRIKNSLQMVASLLRLQARRVESKAVGDALHGAATRVHAMAAVHERLYAGGNFETLSMDNLLSRLCRDIGQAFGCANDVDVEAGPVTVPTDRAIHIALLVNELVTNAIKYGRPPYRITLRSGADGLMLKVADCGAGPARRHPSQGWDRVSSTHSWLSWVPDWSKLASTAGIP